ncbi:MAG: ATP-binding protein, partial [Acidobacteriota bacterium]
AEGKPDAAIALERLWNELGKAHPFSLLCAYPIDGFGGEDHCEPFLQICAEHAEVVPSESYTGLGASDQQARVIAQLQQKASSLESEVARRRDAEAALLLREKELSEINRRKDEFLAMLGHELRNPMAPIVTAMHLMRLRPDEPEVLTRSLSIVDRNLQRVTRLVDDLLDVSRITSGKIELREETVALAAILERAVEQSHPVLSERGHRLTMELPEEPVSLRADPARLEQVLVNLLVNAAKYTDVGGRISLAARREGHEVVIRIRDNGIGMTPELRNRAFDLFVQGPVTSARSSGGLGVGLTLVRRLVDLHRGTVEALSDGPGRGSEFVVRLPVPAEAPQPSGGHPEPRGASTSKRILVVDDNEDAAESLAEYLRAGGHEVRTAPNGPAAIAEAARMRPEVVLLDIGMPEMDGHEVARRLRQNAELRSVLLVALTGYGQESDRLLSVEAGFDHHLVKPVDIRKLDRLLAPPNLA